MRAFVLIIQGAMIIVMLLGKMIMRRGLKVGGEMGLSSEDLGGWLGLAIDYLRGFVHEGNNYNLKLKW